MSDRSDFSANRFKEYCEERGFSRYIFDSDEQDGVKVPQSCKFMVTFENIMVPDGLNAVCLYNDNIDKNVEYHQNYVMLSPIKSVNVVDENVVYTTFEVVCSGYGNENKYYLAAR